MELGGRVIRIEALQPATYGSWNLCSSFYV